MTGGMDQSSGGGAETDTCAQLSAVHFGFTNGDVIVVTGAGSGIGRATARLAASMGLTVAAWDLSEAGLAETADLVATAGGRASTQVVDVADTDAVDAAMGTARDLGTVRHLVNNAGPASSSGLGFDDALRVAVGSVRTVTEAFLTVPVPGASVVNITSVAGTLIGTSPDWYPASKSAILGYTRHLATYRAAQVRANAVAPGLTDTPRMASFAESELGQRIIGRVPLQRMGTPEDIAQAVLFLLSPCASYVNGQQLAVEGGWTVAQ